MKQKLLIATAAMLALLVGCSTPTPPPAKHPSTCTKDPAKEPHFHDCNDNIYLPGHEPEECIPEEPPEPVEPPKPDPIVGTYKVYPEHTGRGEIQIWRIYPNETALEWSNRRYRWGREGERYLFNFNKEENRGWSRSYSFEVLQQSIKGEPDLIAKRSPENKRNIFEAIKVSDDPDHLFDLFSIGLISSREPMFGCANEGRKENIIGTSTDDLFDRRFSTLEECEAICPTAIELFREYRSYSDRVLSEITCPQDRR